jgi:hypothetical protein
VENLNASFFSLQHQKQQQKKRKEKENYTSEGGNYDMIKDDGEIFSNTNNFHCMPLRRLVATFHRCNFCVKEEKLSSYQPPLSSFEWCKINFTLNDILNFLLRRIFVTWQAALAHAPPQKFITKQRREKNYISKGTMEINNFVDFTISPKKRFMAKQRARFFVDFFCSLVIIIIQLQSPISKFMRIDIRFHISSSLNTCVL